MSRLESIKKRIAAHEAEAERLAKHEASAAVARIKEIMDSAGLTLEQLRENPAGRLRGTGKKGTAKKRATRGRAATAPLATKAAAPSAT